jgi:hypothetical protein
LPTDFTKKNISSVFNERITVGKKLKQSKKKNDDVPFLSTKLPSIIKEITNEKFRQYFS